MINIIGRCLKVSIILSLLGVITWSFFKLTLISYNHFLEPTLYADSYRLVEQNQNTDNSLLSWIFSQHNEHRITFSRLNSILEVNLLNLSPGQTGLLQNLLLVFLSSGIWTYLVQKFFKDKSLKIITSLSGILLLLHPWQWENFFWEFQVPWFFINVLVLFGTLLLVKSYKISKNNKNYIDLIFVIIPWLSIFSTGQGFAVAGALSISSFIKSKSLGFKVAISTGIASLIYFSILNYVRPLRHPINFDFLFFFGMLFGGVWHGLFILVFITFIIFVVTKPKIPNELLAPIIFPTLFSIIFSVMTTLSRSHLGLAAALSYRYTTHTLMIGLSSILLLGFIAENKNKNFYKPSIGLATLIITLGSFPLITFNENLPNFKKYSFSRMWQIMNNQKNQIKYYFLCTADKASFKKKNIFLDCESTLPYKYHKNLGPEYFSNDLKVKPKGWHELHAVNSSNILKNKIAINYNLKEINLLASNKLKIKGSVNTRSNLRGEERFFIMANYGSSKRKIIKYQNIEFKDNYKNSSKIQLSIPFEEIIPLEFEGFYLSNISIETRNNSKIIFDANRIL